MKVSVIGRSALVASGALRQEEGIVIVQSGHVTGNHDVAYPFCKSVVVKLVSEELFNWFSVIMNQF